MTGDWLASFSQAVSDFKLFAIAWRGVGGGDGASVQYTFDRSFSILGGFAGASVAGNTLSLPDGNLYDGILQFNGTFSSLSIASDATLQNAQAMTFYAANVPEPPTALLGGMGAAVLLHGLRRRRLPQGASRMVLMVAPIPANRQ